MLALADHVVGALEVGRDVYEGGVILRQINQVPRTTWALHAGQNPPGVDPTKTKAVDRNMKNVVSLP